MNSNRIEAKTTGQRGAPRPVPNPVRRAAGPGGPDRVRAKAYSIWEERVRDGRPGDELSDWLAAERACAAGRA